MAVRLKALADPAPLRLLDTLAARGTCVCGEIVDVLPLARATVSQHLKILNEVGLLQGTCEGPRSCYSVDAGAAMPESFLIAWLADRLPGDS